jgi:N-acetylgalactosamine-6-sulfatase
MYDSATGPGYGIGGAKGITGGRRAFKGGLFEGGIGVPFIARWPKKIPAGKVDETSIFSAVDLLPTFCELANVKLPSSYQSDGISQVRTLMGKGEAKRSKPLFWRTSAPWPAQEAKPDHWVSYVVVSEQWKLCLNRDLEYVELFDLVKDPLEKKNVASKQAKVVSGLKTKLNDWLASLPGKPTGDVFSSLRDPIAE